MRKISLFLMLCVIILGLISGCNQDSSSPTLKDEGFVKPANYAAIVNVEVNASFDVYLDEQAMVLAIEPKNEAASKLDITGVVGRDLAASMRDLMSAICKNHSVSIETAALIELLEGEEMIAEVNVVEIMKDAWADTVAKETVNTSMESALQARLTLAEGCRCLDCENDNWYAWYWYSFGEWERKSYLPDYEENMRYWARLIEIGNKNDPRYNFAVESYNNITYDKFYTKEVQRQLFRQCYENPNELYVHGIRLGLAALTRKHEEIEITFKIVDTEVNANGLTVQSTEYSAEEWFEENPEDRGIIEGLEKAYDLYVRVYENGQWDGKSYYHCAVYLVDGKWYVNHGLGCTPGA